MKNYYQILQVDKDASKEVIACVYRFMAKKYHPDVGNTEEEKQYNQDMMQKINEAYEILGDEQKRKEYNKKIGIDEMSLTEESIQNNKVYRTNNDLADKMYADLMRNSNFQKTREEMQKNQEEYIEKKKKEENTKAWHKFIATGITIIVFLIILIPVLNYIDNHLAEYVRT